MGENSFEQYTKTYSSFSGCDIVAFSLIGAIKTFQIAGTSLEL